jgi:adenosylcobinamide-GDP ribazoletransferase
VPPDDPGDAPAAEPDKTETPGSAGAAESDGIGPPGDTPPAGPDKAGPDKTDTKTTPTARHAGTIPAGLRLAVTTFTVLPVRVTRVDRPAAAVAMRVAPLVGALLGAVVAAILTGVRAVAGPALVGAAVAVAVTALATRGLHLDGLADTIDALGSYRGRERALEIMKSPEVGPFGVAAIVLAIVVPVTALAALAARPGWAVLAGSAAAYATGRLAVAWACRRGVPAARPDGLGALVAGTVGGPALIVATVLTAALATWAVPGRPWQGPLAVLVATGLAAGATAHATRRLGGITGDVLGAAVELATATALVILVL